MTNIKLCVDTQLCFSLFTGLVSYRVSALGCNIAPVGILTSMNKFVLFTTDDSCLALLKSYTVYMDLPVSMILVSNILKNTRPKTNKKTVNEPYCFLYQNNNKIEILIKIPRSVLQSSLSNGLISKRLKYTTIVQ